MPYPQTIPQIIGDRHSCDYKHENTRQGYSRTWVRNAENQYQKLVSESIMLLMLFSFSRTGAFNIKLKPNLSLIVI